MKTDSIPALPRHAFTLIELMVTMSIMLIVILGVVASYIFGLKMYAVTEAKLGASSDARRTIDSLADDIRSAWQVQVGDGNLTQFTESPPGQNQTGSALQISRSGTNASDWVRYFYNPATSCLEKTVNGLSSTVVVSHPLATNTLFTCEDASGNVLTDNSNNRVIGVTLPIRQFQNVSVGPSSYFDSYQLTTKVTRRKFE